MRRSTIVVTALAIGAIGAGGWILLRAKPAPAPLPAPPIEAAEPASQASPAPKLVLPPDPDPPSSGTPAHSVYFRAMIAGDERGLAAARKALGEAKAAHGRTDPAYLRNLESIEKAYVERLERHRGALSSPATR